MEKPITTEEKNMLDQIKEIVFRGNKAEIEKNKEGISIAEIKRRKINNFKI